MFDRFLMGAVTARAAVVAGAPLDAATASPVLVQHDLMVVAFPLKCDGREIDPIDIQIPAEGRPGVPDAGPIAPAARSSRAARRAPPGCAVGRPFAPPRFRGTSKSTSHASARCGGTAPQDAAGTGPAPHPPCPR
jgi:hypothetical protein